jgi:hypothetical protein
MWLLYSHVHIFINNIEFSTLSQTLSNFDKFSSIFNLFPTIFNQSTKNINYNSSILYNNFYITRMFIYKSIHSLYSINPMLS